MTASNSIIDILYFFEKKLLVKDLPVPGIPIKVIDFFSFIKLDIVSII